MRTHLPHSCRPAAGCRGYWVDAEGDVYNGREHKMAAHPDRQGYLRVQVRVGGRRRWKRVHVLVLEAFRGPRPSPGHHGAHGPGGKGDNRLSNLRWATRQENEEDKRASATKTGGKSYRGTHTPDQVRRMREAAREGKSYSEIARQFRAHRSSVSRIVCGKRHGSVA